MDWHHESIRANPMCWPPPRFEGHPDSEYFPEGHAVKSLWKSHNKRKIDFRVDSQQLISLTMPLRWLTINKIGCSTANLQEPEETEVQTLA